MLPALFLIPLVALFRVWLAWNPAPPMWLLGFSPIAAVALCAGIFLPRRLALVVPLGILALSDVAIDAHYGAGFFAPVLLARYGLLALLVGAGLFLRRTRVGSSFPGVLAAALAGSVFFYVASNAFAWAGSSDYAQTPAGLWQALTVGLPGFPPSYVFFRNELVSDALYSMVFVACVRLAAPPMRKGFPSPAAAA
jgi:hypothetical protein